MNTVDVWLEIDPCIWVDVGGRSKLHNVFSHASIVAPGMALLVSWSVEYWMDLHKLSG